MVAAGPLLSSLQATDHSGSKVILQWSLASSPLHPLLRQSQAADTAFILLSNLGMQTSFCSSLTLYLKALYIEKMVQGHADEKR